MDGWIICMFIFICILTYSQIPMAKEVTRQRSATYSKFKIIFVVYRFPVRLPPDNTTQHSPNSFASTAGDTKNVKSNTRVSNMPFACRRACSGNVLHINVKSKFGNCSVVRGERKSAWEHSRSNWDLKYSHILSLNLRT